MKQFLLILMFAFSGLIASAQNPDVGIALRVTKGAAQQTVNVAWDVIGSDADVISYVIKQDYTHRHTQPKTSGADTYTVLLYPRSGENWLHGKTYRFDLVVTFASLGGNGILKATYFYKHFN